MIDSADKRKGFLVLPSIPSQRYTGICANELCDNEFVTPYAHQIFCRNPCRGRVAPPKKEKAVRPVLAQKERNKAAHTARKIKAQKAIDFTKKQQAMLSKRM